ncbi:MAG: hypothetical protein Hyperionvirus14_49 [Hyperionvirus sp.]|uniref:Uncharacterized protein n=1 Tax=Hyperionvirus sp. TaxID=2487770 RepID=A0A3G5A9M3_9VIRU|nr:MAG: hypothetical protein Hyperionvirus14_49 [Hyperionvirus sp.]
MKYKCVDCKFECKSKRAYDKHTITEEHLNETKMKEIDNKADDNIIEADYVAQINQLSNEIAQYKIALGQKETEYINACMELKKENYAALEKLRQEKDIETNFLRKKLIEITERYIDNFRNIPKDVLDFFRTVGIDDDIKINIFHCSGKFSYDSLAKKHIDQFLE